MTVTEYIVSILSDCKKEKLYYNPFPNEVLFVLYYKPDFEKNFKDNLKALNKYDSISHLLDMIFPRVPSIYQHHIKLAFNKLVMMHYHNNTNIQFR